MSLLPVALRLHDDIPTRLGAISMTGCAAGCGAKAETEKLIEGKVASWDYLPITGRYRCGDCRRALEAACKQTGTWPVQKLDVLPPHSIGALKQLPKQPPLKENVR